MFMSKDGKEVFETGDKVVALYSNEPPWRLTGPYPGIFSHYDEQGNPHLFSISDFEKQLWGETRPFDIVYADNSNS